MRVCSDKSCTSSRALICLSNNCTLLRPFSPSIFISSPFKPSGLPTVKDESVSCGANFAVALVGVKPGHFATGSAASVLMQRGEKPPNQTLLVYHLPNVVVTPHIRALLTATARVPLHPPRHVDVIRLSRCTPDKFTAVASSSIAAKTCCSSCTGFYRSCPNDRRCTGPCHYLQRAFEGLAANGYSNVASGR